ncbi:plasmid mobilization relaxosome protein MobC [Streptacidiphilus neutrinimicus]|uniref:plasmid mobilization relaxosome protein MobC n=1 Tax=Streptacidiphilus neutrinimicus TaxID=105420 RepID=UPI00069363AA|nr:plasmid mobilization relaxosome protein MobC [Streptacidiphilus neutrinimicus]
MAEDVPRQGAQDVKPGAEGGPQQAVDGLADVSALLAPRLAYRRRAEGARTLRPQVRYNAAEFEEVQATASALGLRPAAFIADAALALARLGQGVRPYLLGRSDAVHMLAEATVQLSRVGTNLNQLARIANITGVIDDPVRTQLEDVLQRLSRVAGEVEDCSAELIGRQPRGA